MRISLDDEEQKRRSHRLSRNRRRHAGSRSFDSAATIPAALPKQQAGGRSIATKGRQQSGPRPADLAPSQVARTVRRRPGQSAVSRALVALLLVALAAAVAYASVADPFFVSAAQVTGNQHISHEAIMQAAQVEDIHIFWVKPQEVAGRIASLNGIKSVTVHCTLPAQVRIDVKERQPVLVWHVEAHGTNWWLDEEGVVLPYGAEQPPAVIVRDLSGAALQAGIQAAQPGVVAAAQQLATALSGVKEFYYNTDTGLSFIQKVEDMKWPVYIGDGEDLPLKLQAVEVLTGFFTQNDIRPRYLDVRWPGHPVYGTREEKKGSGG